MIEAWKKALVLAPHTDDGELGCGGTMARLVEGGCEVRYVAFSIATRSLPPGFEPDVLAQEVREATAELGIPEERGDLGGIRVLHRAGTLRVSSWGNPWFPHGDPLLRPRLTDRWQCASRPAGVRGPREVRSTFRG